MTPQEQSERARLLAIAETWIGTRYFDHEDQKGIGCDCAGLPKGVCVEAGFIEHFETPFYDPQQWLKKNYEDKQYLETMQRFCNEIKEGAVLPGDFVLYRVAWSFTHGGIVVRWPDYVLHCIKGRGVVGTHGIEEGFIRRKLRRFFRLKRWAI